MTNLNVNTYRQMKNKRIQKEVKIVDDREIKLKNQDKKKIL